MKRVVTLTRGRATTGDLRDALDELAISEGERFIVCAEALLTARKGDPATSHAAARSINAATLGESQEAVLRVLRENGGMTDDVLIAAYVDAGPRFPEQSKSGIRTRRHELQLAGLVMDSGEREKLDSGRYAVIWKPVPKGELVLDYRD